MDEWMDGWMIGIILGIGREERGKERGEPSEDEEDHQEIYIIMGIIQQMRVTRLLRTHMVRHSYLPSYPPSSWVWVPDRQVDRWA